MEISSESGNPIESVAKGATKGILEWTAENIVKFANKLKDKELAFIRDEKTIRLVEKQYNSGELKFYKTHIKDRELLFLIKMGLTLRKLEDDSDRLTNLQEKIFHKYEVKGLHVAQFVQNGILNRYIGILIDEMTTLDKFKENILKILQDIDKHVLFVKGTDTSRMIVQRSTMVLTSHNSSIFIISGMGLAAELVRESEDKLKELLQDYELEKMSDGKKEILFFKRVFVGG